MRILGFFFAIELMELRKNLGAHLLEWRERTGERDERGEGWRKGSEQNMVRNKYFHTRWGKEIRRWVWKFGETTASQHYFKFSDGYFTCDWMKLDGLQYRMFGSLEWDNLFQRLKINKIKILLLSILAIAAELTTLKANTLSLYRRLWVDLYSTHQAHLNNKNKYFFRVVVVSIQNHREVKNQRGVGDLRR